MLHRPATRSPDGRSRCALLESHRREVARFVLVVAREGLIEYVAPIIDHRFQKAVGIELRIRTAARGAARIVQPIWPVLALHSPFNERRESLLKMEQPVLDPS